MFGAIPAYLLMDIAYAAGYREQLTFLDEFPPCIYISKEKLKSVQMGYNWNGSGFISSKDHPAFAELRERLGEEGYIDIQRMWSNGDRVTKPFYLNNMYFDIGDQFSCAPALGGSYDIACRKNQRSPQYGGVSDRPFRPEENPTSTKGDSEEGSEVPQTLPLPL